MPGYEFKIVDGDSGGEVPNGTEGEIVLRSYMVMQGYYKQPEITAETIDEDGWLHTGDMGIIRDDGHVRLIGRYKDMLKVGGENVSPMEVERYLLERHPVALVAIVGHPHDGLDEIPVAFVVASNDHDGTDDDLAEAMIESCRGRIASFKIPRHVIVIDAMPMTASGKIRKHELRGRVSAALAGRAPGT
jgi:fatty-acyl-CoA synthase